MSSLDFNLLCEGFKKRVEIQDKKQVVLVRQICWTVYKGWADPKSAPKSIDDYWPLGEKKKAAKRTKKQEQQLKNTISYLKTLHNNG